MNFKKIVFLLLLLFLLIFSISTEVQADEFSKTGYKDVKAAEILKQIENGENINLTKCRIIGAVSLEGVEGLEIIPNTKKVESVPFEERLKVVKSSINIHDSIFEDYVDFSGASFKNAVSFEGLISYPTVTLVVLTSIILQISEAHISMTLLIFMALILLVMLILEVREV